MAASLSSPLLNHSLNNEILLSNEIGENINTLSNAKLEVTDSIALKTAELKKLEGKSSSINSNDDISKLNAKLEESNNLQSQLDGLHTQIENKNLVVSGKISQINGLNSKLNPLNGQIDSLTEKKTKLQKQYNLELNNINNSFNNNELSKSKELADNLNYDINITTNNIKILEINSSKLETDIKKLNLEINVEKNVLNQLSMKIVSSQKDLSIKNDIIDAKELELDSLRNADLVKNNQQLNQKFNKLSLEKDFINAQFEKTIDKEIEALRYYGNALGDTAEEIDFAIEEVGIILDGDPRKANAFDIRKYGTYAGLSQSDIQVGINAINNDDWDTTKKVYKDITKALAKNPKWVVDVPSEAELNVMIAEEQALQQAVEIVKKGDEVKRQIDSIINEKTKPYQQISTLNKTKLQYAVLYEGSLEANLVNEQYNEIINNNNEFKSLKEELADKQNLLAKAKEETKKLSQNTMQFTVKDLKFLKNYKI